ncbi:hypothetical protein B0J18DRAFT_442420 [Chaetomium sp. MPI-SDFR-AT-0129]|uniref:NmrA-like domain-containing protein n=1 Tax=Dichotomopilus funicola TaxID=1934379 RepID=A0AAN6UW28_9PEZI|nr:hypothetical protein B0J18DRAFT_442420 [Chaetomium sp. MPI-SDFR-AT-0129]KAK4140277.1 hypothetical protein C8A04DRAFT_40065 [Dichotomopilus funicola]
MSQLLAIVGATGQQGGSVANFVLSDPVLSARYKVRALTRDTTKEAADALRAKGAEVVQADLEDPASLKAAFAGVDTIFAATKTVYDEQAKERELRQSKDVADAAVAAGVKFIVYSSEVHCETVSGGKYPVAAYDSKNEAEQYIRTLPVKSAFYYPATFMQNLAAMMAPRPVPDSPGVYAIANIFAGDRPYPWLDVVADAGKFVGAILAAPEKFDGKVLYAGAELATMDQIAEKISKQTGKTVKYVLMPEEKFRAYLPPAAADAIVNMFLFCSDFGYYGPDSAKLLEETVAQVPYKLTSLDEYIAANVKLA